MSEGFLPITHGRLETVTGTTPAANTAPTVVIPTNQRYRVITIKAGLTTDATVANRQPGVIIIASALVLGFWFQTGTQPASSTHTWYWVPQSGINANTIGNNHSASIPEQLVLDDGIIISLATNNQQTGDQWTAMTVYVETWLEE